jgi:aminoglycoside phosphotransferase (APT) family kinase protein
MAANMPPAEVVVTPALVRSLLSDQRPDLADRDISLLAHGWDNETFRVGDDLVARMPRRDMAAGLVENEARWLPLLASRLTVPVSAPSFLGEPGHGYPWRWVLVPWIPGESAALSEIDHDHVAVALAEFLRCLHVPAPADAPVNPFRSTPLQVRDEAARSRIQLLSDEMDTERVTGIWDESLGLPEHAGPKVWLHGDLHPHNILVIDGRLSAVIDFGDICRGDPAIDLAIGWTLFPSDARRRFREHYGGDEALWGRARGWALHYALSFLANSADNPTMACLGAIGVNRLLEED